MKPIGPFHQYLIHEFVEDYRDGIMSRRDMIRRIILITGGVASAATVLTQMGITPMTRAAMAQETTPTPSGEPMSPLTVAADDPRVVTAEILITARDGAAVIGYQAMPSGDAASPIPGASPVPVASPVPAASPVASGGLPLILVCHENRGLTEHIRDVTRRYAVEGYAACALDLVSREGGTSGFGEDEISGLLSEIDPARHVDDFADTFGFFQTVVGVDTTRAGMTGFCFGGGITWRAATLIPELKAAAPYYGPPPDLVDVPKIQAAVLGVYSDDPDDFANEGRDALVAALEAAGVTHQINIYPNTQHAFHNDTSPRYNEEAAVQAWNDTLAWFAQYV